MEVTPELAAARVDYLATFGSKPHHKLNEAKLREKIAAYVPPDDAPAPDAPPPLAAPPPAPPKPAGVRVMLLCGHVFLPEDLGRPDWATSQTTKQYDGETEDGRRLKLTVHPTLAAFLQERKQAEILD